LGPEIVNQLSQKLGEGSHFVLLARQKDLLEKRCAELSERYPKHSYRYAVVDNSTVEYEEFEKIISENLAAFSESGEGAGALLVHNSGSTGGVDRKLTDFEDRDELQAYFNANLNSMILLTSAFKKLCTLQDKLIINISSGAALDACPGLGIYCVGKAARKMYCANLAVENPDMKVLSYSPGPLKTDMLAEVRSSKMPELQELLTGLETKMITVQQTTSKLMEILEKNDFTSGAHVDYYGR